MMIHHALVFSTPAVRRRITNLSLLVALLPGLLSGLVAFTLPCTWTPTFVEDFNASTLNAERWNMHYGPGKGELQQYIPDASTLHDGILVIKADRSKRGSNRFLSGVLTTEGLFSQKYGYFEVRAKVPKGQGLFPAFWLLPASKKWPPEIDVFEVLGHQPARVYMSYHYKGKVYPVVSKTEHYDGPDFSQDFHVFAVAWSPNTIQWYVDGELRHTSDAYIPQEPMFLLINLAVGGVWPGPPDGSTPFPSYLQVDYVKVFKKTCQMRMPFKHQQDEALDRPLQLER